MVAFESERSNIVVDCGGDVVQRLLVGGVELDHIEALILTHEHPDHVSGFPLFMERIWLAERRRPIPVYGPEPALQQAGRIFEAFDTSGWKGMPEIEWHTVALEEGAAVLENEQWRITAAPGEHSVPVMGIRVEDVRGGGVVVYSADTERSAAITRLARGADILVHEASGGFSGHTSVGQAAQIAAEAKAGRLLLVHLPPEVSDRELQEARRSFGEVDLGADGATYPF